MDKSRGASALDTWCASERGRAARLAFVVGVRESTVARWRDGSTVPGAAAQLLVSRLTDGAVPLDAWGSP